MGAQQRVERTGSAMTLTNRDTTNALVYVPAVNRQLDRVRLHEDLLARPHLER